MLISCARTSRPRPSRCDDLHVWRLCRSLSWHAPTAERLQADERVAARGPAPTCKLIRRSARSAPARAVPARAVSEVRLRLQPGLAGPRAMNGDVCMSMSMCARAACARRERGAAATASGLPRSCVGAMFVRAEPGERVTAKENRVRNGKICDLSQASLTRVTKRGLAV